MLKDPKLRVFLYNYFIKVGSFANLQKYDGKLYRELLAYKKKKAPESKESLSEWLQSQLMSKYAKRPKTKNIWKVVEYNSLVYSVAINIAGEVNTKEHLPVDMLNGFDNADHLKSAEPAYYKYLENHVPRWQGPVDKDYPGILRIEGYKYWGDNLTERCDFINDLIAFFKGNVNCQYLTPYINQRLRIMLATHGNLNLIGMDNLDLIYDLTDLKESTRATSIAELLELGGFHFEPVDYKYGDKALYLKRSTNYAVVLEGCDKEIMLAKEIYQLLKELGKLQEIYTEKHTMYGAEVEVLMVEVGGTTMPVHALYTRNIEGFVYKDMNTLNLRLANIS